MSLSQSELILENFLKEHNIPFSHFERCNLNNSEGKFDAGFELSFETNNQNETDWMPRLNEYLQNLSTTSHMNTGEAIRLHNLVFVEEEENFENHFVDVACPLLNKHRISFYRYKSDNDFFLLYGLDEQMHLASHGLIHRGDGFGIFQASTDDKHCIVSLSLNDKLLHILFDKDKVFYHQMTKPWFPPASRMPTFVPPMNDDLESKVLKLGYQIRFDKTDMPVGHKDLDNILAHFSAEEIVVPKFFHAIIEEILDMYVQHLTANLPTRERIDADNVKSWLLMREKAESIMMVVGIWKESAREKLDHIDSRFPLHLTSHILPQSRLLAEVWLYDPMYWWGQGAALHSMLGESDSE